MTASRSAPRRAGSSRSWSSQANALGYDVMMGHEYEYYLLDAETKQRLYEGIHIFHTVRNHYAPFLDALVPTLRAYGIDVITHNCEYAGSQYETVYGPGLNMAAADKAFAFKNGMKELAHRNGYIASFMAKPFAGHSGSGCHLHVSLVNRRTRKNAFHDAAAEGGALGARRVLHRRHAGACAGDDAADQPDAELLPPRQALHLRAVERELGHAGPLGAGAHQGDRRRAHASRDARRLGGEQSLSPRLRRARRGTARA